MKYHSHKNKQGGFTLFFAVMAVSIVISIGITLSIIALKETSLAGIRRESQLAYYAAEAGTACAMYHILENLKTNPAPAEIIMNCNNTSATYSAAAGYSHYFDFESPYQYRASTTLTSYNGGTTWDISSEGLNRRGLATIKLLRSQKVRIGKGAIGSANDVMILVDHSGSICPTASPTWNNGVYYPANEQQNCSYHQAMRNSVLSLIDKINPDPASASANRLGLLTFAGVGQQVNNNSSMGYDPSFGKPRLQTHLNATKLASKDYIASSSGYLKISYNDGTNITDSLRIAGCELNGKALDAAAYESNCTTSDPNPPTDPISGTGTHDRPDNNYPDTIILFTDGANNVYNNAGNRIELQWTNTPNACGLAWEQVIAQAKQLKDPDNDGIDNNTANSVKIYVVGVGTEMKNKACGGPFTGTGPSYSDYTKVRVETILRDKVASKVNGVGQFYYVNTYDESTLVDTFNTIVQAAGLSVTVIE
jgi:hypothetical protein